jgi:hypothetical protein
MNEESNDNRTWQVEKKNAETAHVTANEESSIDHQPYLESSAENEQDDSDSRMKEEFPEAISAEERQYKKALNHLAPDASNAEIAEAIHDFVRSDLPASQKLDVIFEYDERAWPAMGMVANQLMYSDTALAQDVAIRLIDNFKNYNSIEFFQKAALGLANIETIDLSPQLKTMIQEETDVQKRIRLFGVAMNWNYLNEEQIGEFKKMALNDESEIIQKMGENWQQYGVK